jgi:2-dehydropantoate 2-reductase
MRVCVYGAGSIGGYLAVVLSGAGADVSVVARGAHLAAIRERGLTLRDKSGERTVQVKASEHPADLGPQDSVIVALKAHQVRGIASRLPPLFRADTSVVTATNGIPWWYFYGFESPWRDRILASVDPGGVIWKAIGPERAIGCVVYPASEVAEPGVIRHIQGDRFTLGEPTGESTPRVEGLAALFRKAGLKAPVRSRIREEIWVKLWGNLSFNPISALTRATLEDICRDPGTRAVARAMMVEAEDVARRLGVTMPIDVDKRIAGAQAVGAHKTSMLQDLERGQPLEIEELTGVVAELGRLTGAPTPTIDVVLALVRQLAAGRA